jgi:hypothetical protein
MAWDREYGHLSERIASNPRQFLDVIDRILTMDYLKPDLRRHVIRLQERLIQAELQAHYRAGDRRTASPPERSSLSVT